MKGRVLLLVLDGWGMAPASKGNAISLAKKPNFDYLWSTYPHTTLQASGEAVGLPAGQIGNSEVGHLNIGAGRVVWQDLPRISNAIKDGTFFKNEGLLRAIKEAKMRNKPLHLIGMVSPGGVHSHISHLYALLEMAKHEGVSEVYIHAITDGRDTPPKSAHVYIDELKSKIAEIGIGKIATIAGRYYAMDRDSRWDRINRAYNAQVLGQGELANNAESAIESSYKLGITDEFIKPTVIDNQGLITDDSVVIFFNLRSDRPRQLTEAFIEPKFSNFKREHLKNLYFVTMTEYKAGLPVSGIAFAPNILRNTLGEVISDKKLKQFHIAETEKYTHVTFYFNGGQEDPFPGEDRVLVPSPRVATYDLKPEMSAEGVTTKLLEKIGFYDFILVNFANPDMDGHTGKIEAASKGIETVDACLGGVVNAALSFDYDVIITADHGNAEKMINEDGSPCTAHTTNPVPFILVSSEKFRLTKQDDLKLGNIAPTVLDLMKIKKPKEMTEKSLIINY